jgi:hypothetical protein
MECVEKLEEKGAIISHMQIKPLLHHSHGWPALTTSQYTQSHYKTLMSHSLPTVGEELSVAGVPGSVTVPSRKKERGRGGGISPPETSLL